MASFFGKVFDAVTSSNARNHALGYQKKNAPKPDQQNPYQVFCDCGTQMNEAKIQSGSLFCNRCNNGIRHKCYYCPIKQHHNNGSFFYCFDCAKIYGKNPNEPNIGTGTLRHPMEQKKEKQKKPEIMFKGYMKKLSSLTGTFQKRYFRLYSNRKMFYFNSQGSMALNLGCCDLTNIKKMEKKKDKGFIVTTAKNNKYVFEHWTEKERDQWFEVIWNSCFKKTYSGTNISQQYYVIQDINNNNNIINNNNNNNVILEGDNITPAMEQMPESFESLESSEPPIVTPQYESEPIYPVLKKKQTFQPGAADNNDNDNDNENEDIHITNNYNNIEISEPPMAYALSVAENENETPEGQITMK